MPTYDYECKNCSTHVELVKKISSRDDTTEDTCNTCLSEGTLVRLVSAPLIAYSISVNGGYGSRVPDGFKDVLKKIHERSPGSKMDKTSSYM